MKLRPLKRLEAGFYQSYDKEWDFVFDNGWYVSRIEQNRTNNPFFLQPYPTLKSLVSTLETYPFGEKPRK